MHRASAKPRWRNALARTLGLEFHRIPVHQRSAAGRHPRAAIYDRDSAKFSFHPGPIFAQVICRRDHRASPKAQSALLRRMEEGQVSYRRGNAPACPRLFS